MTATKKELWVQAGYLPFALPDPCFSTPLCAWELKPTDRIQRSPSFLVLASFGQWGASADLREGGHVPELNISAFHWGLLCTSLSSESQNSLIPSGLGVVTVPLLLALNYCTTLYALPTLFIPLYIVHLLNHPQISLIQMCPQYPIGRLIQCCTTT